VPATAPSPYANARLDRVGARGRSDSARGADGPRRYPDHPGAELVALELTPELLAR